MGRTQMEGLKDGVDQGLWTKEEGLYAYIKSNFYPPHPEHVVESMMKGFKKYWKRKINLYELTKACYLRDTDGTYKYFESFLNEEDLD